MIDPIILMAQLEQARLAVELSRAELKKLEAGTPDFSEARLAFMHALIHHMSIVSVLQARQHEQLSEEVAELRARLPDHIVH